MKNGSSGKLVLLLPWTEYLDVHLKKDTGLFPEYISREYDIPYEIVFTDSYKSTKKQSIGSGGNIIKLQSGKNPSPIPPPNKKEYIQMDSLYLSLYSVFV